MMMVGIVTCLPTPVCRSQWALLLAAVGKQPDDDDDDDSGGGDDIYIMTECLSVTKK